MPSPSVIAELRLDARQQKRLQSAFQLWGRETKGLHALPPAERSVRKQQTDTEMRRAVFAILTPVQERRLYQIALQDDGVEALVREEVIRALGLVWKQRSEIRSVIFGYETWGREFVREIEGPDRDISLLHDLREEQQQAYQRGVAVLTDPQRAAWQRMIGSSFDFQTIGYSTKLQVARKVDTWLFALGPRPVPAAAGGAPRENRVSEPLSIQHVNAMLLFRRLGKERVVPVHVGVMIRGDKQIDAFGTPEAIQVLKSGVRVGDARIERLDDRAWRAVLAPEKAKIEVLRAALLDLPDAGTVVAQDGKLVLEGSRSWIKQAILAVVRAEMESAQSSSAAAPSPV